ncbi:hypothetical protein DHEL01_v200622 [Diaporthe helianthi]|uniref:Uncharacterized protein n=1 Tax=Diaporthe helianthi TaxID=158607 RepID=A0A2P5IER1_DIAHE|nr:hypothetical protein DHEL01_v200622 [Diaporthe helianthi]
MEDLHALEKEGLEILMQTGGLEAADASWMKARGICQEAADSFEDSFTAPRPYYERTRRASNAQKWAQLRRVHGNACAAPIINFWHRLSLIRVSEVLRLVQRGGHLAIRHGRGPIRSSDLGHFVGYVWKDSYCLGMFFSLHDWEPQPSEEIQIGCAVAAVLRLLDYQSMVGVAIHSINLAIEISPDNEAVKQEAFRVTDWVGRILSSSDASFYLDLRDVLEALEQN